MQIHFDTSKHIHASEHDPSAANSNHPLAGSISSRRHTNPKSEVLIVVVRGPFQTEFFGKSLVDGAFWRSFTIVIHLVNSLRSWEPFIIEPTPNHHGVIVHHNDSPTKITWFIEPIRPDAVSLASVLCSCEKGGQQEKVRKLLELLQDEARIRIPRKMEIELKGEGGASYN